MSPVEKEGKKMTILAGEITSMKCSDVYHSASSLRLIYRILNKPISSVFRILEHKYPHSCSRFGEGGGCSTVPKCTCSGKQVLD